jgi:hypothetical protein
MTKLFAPHLDHVWLSSFIARRYRLLTTRKVPEEHWELLRNTNPGRSFAPVEPIDSGVLPHVSASNNWAVRLASAWFGLSDARDQTLAERIADSHGCSDLLQ